MRNCPECNKPMEGMCEECGVTFEKQELIVTDLHNYVAKPQRFYKREDHFKEVLAQFQGREGKDFTAETIEMIKAEVKNPAQTDVAEIKRILRKLKMTKYVENAFYITFAIAGQDPPYIKREIEDKMLRMFARILQAYPSVSTEKRRSFLSYYYIIFKLLELMGQRELLARVPLLRTKLRIRQHDAIWKQLCEELDWTFKRTSFAYVAASSKPRQGAYKKPPWNKT